MSASTADRRYFKIIDLLKQANSRIWNDFVPFFEKIDGTRKWITAQRLLRAPKITVKCDALTRECKPAKLGG